MELIDFEDVKNLISHKGNIFGVSLLHTSGEV